MRLFRRHSEPEAEAEPEPAPKAASAVRQRDPRVGPDPVIDVNVPVSNPELLAAIQTAMAGGGQPGDVEAMKIALARAVYLVPVLYSQPPEDRGNGRLHIPAGTTMAFPRFPMSETYPNARGFGACTSEAAYQRCAPEGAVQQVMKAADVYFLALDDTDCDGVILNPADGTSSFPVYRDWCEEIRDLLGG
jgi:hypothetical protein